MQKIYEENKYESDPQDDIPEDDAGVGLSFGFINEPYEHKEDIKDPEADSLQEFHLQAPSDNGQKRRCKDTIPKDLKEAFFFNVEPPNLVTDYSVVGFEAEHCLVKYDVQEITQLIVQRCLEDLHKNFSGYPLEMTFLPNEKTEICTNCVVWDIEKGILLKLDEDRKVTQALRGFEKLSQLAIEGQYGEPPIFEFLKWPEKTKQMDFEHGSHWTLIGYFETCLIPVICQFEHLKQQEKITNKNNLKFALELKEVHYRQVLKFREIKEEEANCPQYISNVQQFVQKQEDLKKTLAILKREGIKTFLTTESNEYYLNKIMTASLGPDWIDLFDICITKCRKPLFFKQQSPFFRNNKRISTHEQLQKALQENKIINEGNASLLTEYFAQDLPQKIAYFGPNYFTDCLPVNQLQVSPSSWDSIAVVEEISLIDPNLEQGKKADLSYNKKIWGKNWFSDEQDYNSDVDDSISQQSESEPEFGEPEVFSHNDLDGEYIDPALMQKPKVNYFVKEIDKCSRYAVAFAKNIKYLMGGLVPENSAEQLHLFPSMGLLDPTSPEGINIKQSLDQNDFLNNLSLSMKNSLNPDNAVRQQAEKFIMESRKNSAFCPALLEISANVSLDHSIRLSAAVQLGKVVVDNWDDAASRSKLYSSNRIHIESNAKAYIRSNLITKMHLATNSIIKQYCRCITAIASCDHPHSWPALDDVIKQLISSKNEKGILVGLLTLLSYLKNFQFFNDNDRQPFYKLLEECLAILQQLVHELATKCNPTNETALHILHLIMKIFNVSTNSELVPFLTSRDRMDPWLRLANAILALPVPDEFGSQTDDAKTLHLRNTHIFWKMKSQASKLTYQLFYRFQGNVQVTDAFKQYLFGEVASLFIVQQITIIMERKFIAKKCLSFAMKFILACSKIREIMDNTLKKCIDEAFFEACVLNVMKTKDDQLFMTEEPVEWIRRDSDFIETLQDPKKIMLTLVERFFGEYSEQLEDITHKNKLFWMKKAKPEFMKPFLNYLVKNLDQASQLKSDNWQQKEALLHCFGTLHESIIRHKDNHKNVIQILEKYVLPEITSSNSLLRLRAIWVYRKCSDLNSQLSSQHLQTVIQGIGKALINSELPVKVESAITMSKLLYECPTAKSFVQNDLKSTLQVYLTIMNEIDNEDIFFALESLLSIFKDQIGPHVLPVVQQLVQKFNELLNSGEDNDEVRLDKMTALSGCMQAIRSVVEAAGMHRNLLNQIKLLIFPIIEKNLSYDGRRECIEDSITCVTLMIYYGIEKGQNIPAELWSVFPEIVYLVSGDGETPDEDMAYECLEQATVAIQNYMIKDSETFTSSGPEVQSGKALTFHQITINFVKNVLQIDLSSFRQKDGILAIKVLITMLQNIDCADVMPQILEILLEKIKDKENPNPEFVTKLFEAMCMCFFNNAPKTLELLASQNALIPVFNQLFDLLTNFKCRSQIRSVIFGLSSILSMPQLPDLIKNRIAEIGKEMTKLVLQSVAIRVDLLKKNEGLLAQAVVASPKTEDRDDMAIEAMLDQLDKPNVKVERINEALGEKRKRLPDSILTEIGPDQEDEYQYAHLVTSATDGIDELVFLRDELEKLTSSNPANLAAFFSLISKQDSEAIKKSLSSLDHLITRERQLKEKLEHVKQQEKKNMSKVELQQAKEKAGTSWEGLLLDGSDCSFK